ncbi:hypothetical protein J5N97_009259 [Dioscorea zingiberensis]|uniref:Pectinesterase inhibitor domain-containing protein n=1 Tax=Dioscorea zingiberensis TaxID=325984 RepID=A0A9D5HLH9_9LILI|nr:hypothetical protein J5N97_009259 [Dioscorea zingiberensis]
MSAFQDFGPLTERRKAERQQSRRKKLMIIGSSIGVLAIVAVIGVAAVVQHTGGPDGDSPASGSHKQLHSASKSVEMICSSTDYKKTCASSLSKATNSTSSPKDLIKAAVDVIFDEATKAFGKSQLFNSDDKMVKGAILVCQDLLNSTRDSLTTTLKHLNVDNADQLAKQRRALKSWLAAVMTNTETCIDAFPEGDMKKKMTDAMVTAKQMTSNAMAIIDEGVSLLSALKIPGFTGRDLREEPAYHPDGTPSWINEADRRLLKQRAATKYTPNVTVAQDGTGDFKTITEALAAIPKNRDTGRCGRQLHGRGAGHPEHRRAGRKPGGGPPRELRRVHLPQLPHGGLPRHVVRVLEQAVLPWLRDQCGTVDFIFGDATAVIQNSVLTIRKPDPNQQNIITAQGRTDKREDTGLVIHKCRITAEPGAESFPNYLARPWKFKSRTVYLENEIGGFISPDGYMAWPSAPENSNTCFYAEYGNVGPGADTSKRVKWQGIRTLTKADAARFTPGTFIGAGDWVKKAGVPVQLGFYKN